VNFAKTGDPNGEGLPVWPAFNENNPQIIELGDEVKASPLPYKDQLIFMDSIN
jgi:para-nitrobenzyl esterase